MAFNFDNVLKCPTCLKTKLTERFGKKSLCETVERPYQGLSIDFVFSGRVKRDKKGVIIKASKKDVETMNDETTWILIFDIQTPMLHRRKLVKIHQQKQQQEALEIRR